MPDSHTPDPIRLERAIDRLRAVALTLSIGFVLLVAHQFTPRTQLDAQRFVLRDSAKVFRGALEMREDGAAVVRLNDANTRPRVYAMVTADGRPRFRLSDGDGIHRLQAELDPEQRIHLFLSDATGRSRLHLWVDRNGETSITRRDSTGQHPIGEVPRAETRRPARR